MDVHEPETPKQKKKRLDTICKAVKKNVGVTIEHDDVEAILSVMGENLELTLTLFAAIHDANEDYRRKHL